MCRQPINGTNYHMFLSNVMVMTHIGREVIGRQ